MASRLSSADDLASVIRALGDRRSPHRLTAVLSEPGAVVVSRGATYAQLPPTARRLLEAEGTRSRQGLADRERVELELDGPVSGLVTFRVQIDRAGRAEVAPEAIDPGETPEIGGEGKVGNERG
jgi:hypothetical protein